jgi:hypothetical protein
MMHVHRVARVVPALVARHGREMRRQHVDDFSLAFVAPLRAKHGDIRSHHSVISYAKYEEFRVSERAPSIDGYAPNVNKMFFRNSFDKLAADSYLLILHDDARTRRSTT